MQSKICVLQVIPNLDVSGASQGCVDVANYLTEKNYNSYIATNSGQNIKKVSEHETKVIKVPVHSKNPLIIILNIFRLARIIKLFGINILHVRSRAPAWSSYFACLMTRTKYVSTFHGTYNFNNALKKYYNSVMLMTDGTIAISKFIYNEIKTKYQKMPKVIKIIPRGIDLEFFNVASIDQQIKNDILKEFKINKDAIKIMLPGRMTEWKGHLLLLKAFEQVSQQTEKKLELLMVGPDDNTSLKKRLTTFVHEKDIEGNVHFISARNDINNFYSIADIVVSPSTDPEAFGRISVEAQAMGKFVIASNHGGSTETIINNETGYLFNNADENDLSAKILKAINENKHCSEIVRQACITNVQKNYSDKKMCDSTLNFYNEIIG